MLIHAYERTDGRTDVAKITVALALLRNAQLNFQRASIQSLFSE